MRVLITGGAGYLGSKAVDHFLRAGYRVEAFDNFMYDQHSLLPLCASSSLTVTRGDVRDKGALNAAVNRNDVVVHLAAIVGAPACDRDTETAVAVNYTSVLRLMEVVEDDHTILFPNTNSAYGKGDAVTEESAMTPLSAYAEQKLRAEEAVMKHPHAVSFRLATVFGTSFRMRLDLLVNHFVWKAVTDGFVALFEADFRRNFIHIIDVVRTFEYAIKNIATLKGEVYNVGLSAANLTKRELCEKIREQVPDFTFLEVPGKRDKDQRDYNVSNRKIEKTGWSPIMTMEMGITELIRAYASITDRRYSNV